MVENPEAILAYASAWGLGYAFLKLIRFTGPRLETASVSFLAGLFLQSCFSFLLGLGGAPLTRGVFLVADTTMTTLVLILLVRMMYRYVAGASRPGDRGAGCPAYGSKVCDSKLSLREIWFLRSTLLILTLYFVMHAVINAERVVSFTDAVMSYDFRARAMAYEGKLLASVYRWPEVQTPNFMYPPLTTMFSAHYYALGGNNPKLLYSFLPMASSAVMGVRVLKLSNNRVAAVMAASLFAFLPVVRKFSLLEALDFPAVVFFTMGVSYLVAFSHEQRRPHLLLSAVGFAGVGFLRPEDPLFFAGVLYVAAAHFGIGKKDWTAAAIPALVYAAVYGSHLYFVHALAGANPESQLNFSPTAVFNGRRLFETGWAFLRHFSSDRFMLLGPLSVLLIFFGGRDTGEGDLLKTLLAAFCVSWLILVLADNSGDWKEMRLEWSHFRIFIRITPLFVLYVARHPAVLRGLDEFFGAFIRRLTQTR